MTLAARVELRKDVIPAEGTGPIKNGRLMPYLDCCGKYWRDCTCEKRGYLTIGHGRNLDANGLTKLEAEVLLDHDLAQAEMECRNAFDWFDALADARQRVIVEMVFNLGLTKFREFHNTIAAIQAKDYKRASSQMLASKWAAQVKGRALRMARMMRDGAA